MTNNIFSVLVVTDSDLEPAQVFISYQWDCQDEVKLLRDRLERSGFMCWMDIGQMGGGDQLYNKIDEAVRQCKVSFCERYMAKDSLFLLKHYLISF